METVIAEEEVDMLILGSASADEETGHTTMDFIKTLSQSIADTYKIEVVVLGGGEEVFSVKAGD